MFVPTRTLKSLSPPCGNISLRKSRTIPLLRPYASTISSTQPSGIAAQFKPREARHYYRYSSEEQMKFGSNPDWEGEGWQGDIIRLGLVKRIAAGASSFEPSSTPPSLGLSLTFRNAFHDCMTFPAWLCLHGFCLNLASCGGVVTRVDTIGSRSQRARLRCWGRKPKFVERIVRNKAIRDSMANELTTREECRKYQTGYPTHISRLLSMKIRFNTASRWTGHEVRRAIKGEKTCEASNEYHRVTLME